MSDAQPVDGEDADALQRPRFRGCVFCYSGEWAVYAGRKAYRRLSADRTDNRTA